MSAASSRVNGTTVTYSMDVWARISIFSSHSVRSGGAADFALRYREAMGPLNRWYCSEFHGRDVSDPETLWNYYTHCGRSRAWDSHAGKPHDESAALSIAG